MLFPIPARFQTRARGHAKEAALPDYVLYQPIIVVIGRHLLGWGLPAVAESLLISVMALIGARLLCDLGGHRTPVTRFLCGMQARPR